MLGVNEMNRLSVAVLCALAMAALIIFGCSGQPYALQPPKDMTGPKSVQAFVVSHGWHTGLVLPAANLNSEIPELALRFGVPAYYEIGWGDKGFYQAQDVTTGLALRAMFWSSGSVVHVVAIPETPEASFPESQTTAVCLAPAQVEQMKKFISTSIVHDRTGHVVTLGKGIYGDSQFYDGVGRYSLLNTCNKWTAKALKSAGLQISPSLKLTAGSIMTYVQDNAAPGPCAN